MHRESLRRGNWKGIPIIPPVAVNAADASRIPKKRELKAAGGHTVHTGSSSRMHRESLRRGNWKSSSFFIHSWQNLEDASRIPKKRELKDIIVIITCSRPGCDASRIPKKRELKEAILQFCLQAFLKMHRESLRRGNWKASYGKAKEQIGRLMHRESLRRGNWKRF